MSFWSWLELKHGVPVIQVFLVHFVPLAQIPVSLSSVFLATSITKNTYFLLELS